MELPRRYTVISPFTIVRGSAEQWQRSVKRRHGQRSSGKVGPRRGNGRRACRIALAAFINLVCRKRPPQAWVIILAHFRHFHARLRLQPRMIGTRCELDVTWAALTCGSLD